MAGLSLGLGLGLQRRGAGAAGGGAGANAVAIASAEMSASTGNQTITTENLGGLTPKAAMIFWSAASPLESALDDTWYGHGATDGVNQWANALIKADLSFGRGRRSVTNGCVLVTNESSELARASFVGFVPNGVTINWVSAATTAFKMLVVLFAGEDLSVKAGVLNPTTSTQTENIGFSPEVALVSSANTTIPGDDNSFANISVGISYFNGSGYNERAVASNCGNSTTNDGNTLIENGSAAQYGATTETYRVNLNNFTSTGFDYSGTAAAAASDDLGYLAVSYDGQANYAVGTWALPTSTGESSVSGLAFQPGTVLMAYANMKENGFVGAAAFTDTQLISRQGEYIGGDSGSAKSTASNSKLFAVDPAGTTTLSATLTSMNSDGWTMDFTTAIASPQAQAWYLAVGF